MLPTTLVTTLAVLLLDFQSPSAGAWIALPKLAPKQASELAKKLGVGPTHPRLANPSNSLRPWFYKPEAVASFIELDKVIQEQFLPGREGLILAHVIAGKNQCRY